MPKALTFAIAFLLGCTPAIQAQVELGVLGGVYAPTANFAIGSTASSIGPYGGKQQTALSYGALARLWVTPRLGFETTVIRANSDVAILPPFGAAPDSTASAHLTIGTLAALLRFPVGDLNNSVWIDAGVVVLSRAGSVYRPYSNRSSFGATAGGGTRIPLNGSLGVDIGAKGLFYNLALRDSGGTLPSRYQIDMVGWAGLVVWLGKARDVE